MRRLVVASAILATLLAAPLGLAAALSTSASVPTDSGRATAAVEYLWAAQWADGSLDGSIGETADFVIGTAAAGYDPAKLKTCAQTATALGFLATASDAAAGDAAKTGKTVLAVVAAGGNPAKFAGRDLLARLASLYHSAGGTYGDGSTFGQSFAILAVEAAGGSVPGAALAELKALQDADGSWSYGTAPVAAGQGDTNSTAIALMALDSAGDHSADAPALAYLHTQQLADGGFPYQNSSVYGPPASDPDSDAIVLQALVATGQNPEGSSWRQGTHSVLTHLRSIQTAKGGFAYPAQAPNAFTTSQVPAALVRIPYAGAVNWTIGRVPPRQCIGTAETATPGARSSPSATPYMSLVPPATATPHPTPRPTARPTARPTVRPTVRPTAKPTVRPRSSAPRRRPTPRCRPLQCRRHRQPPPQPQPRRSRTPARLPRRNRSRASPSPRSTPPPARRNLRIRRRLRRCSMARSPSWG